MAGFWQSNDQMAKGTVCIQMAVFGKFAYGCKIYGQLTEGNVDISLHHTGKGNIFGIGTEGQGIIEVVLFFGIVGGELLDAGVDSFSVMGDDKAGLLFGFDGIH